MKYIIKTSLALFLTVALFLCASPAVYADDGDEGGMNVDVAVVGDNSKVGLTVEGNNTNTGVALIGEDTYLGVNANGNHQVYLNGRDVTKPIIIEDRTPTVIVDKWSEWRIKEVIFPWMERTAGALDMTMEGLSKLILLATDSHTGNIALSYQIADTSGNVKAINTDIGTVNTRLEGIDAGVLSLNNQHNALATETRANYQMMLERLDKIEADYNTKLVIMLAVLLSLITALGAGLAASIRRLRKVQPEQLKTATTERIRGTSGAIRGARI